MKDRVTLDGVLMNCDQNPSRVRNPADCENARIANERLANRSIDPEVEKRREADFEKARDQRRLAQDKLREEQEARTKVDAYTLPLVPVEPAASSKDAAPAAPVQAVPGGPPLAGNGTH